LNKLSTLIHIIVILLNLAMFLVVFVGGVLVKHDSRALVLSIAISLLLAGRFMVEHWPAKGRYLV
jgi:hypothetical protein